MVAATPNALTIIPDETNYSPEMRALTGIQRGFVEAMLLAPSLTPTEAYRQAAPNCQAPGAAAVEAHRLMRNEKVLQAMRVEAQSRLRSGVLLGSAVLIEIAMDMSHKDRYRAARDLLAHGGLIAATEQKITVKDERNQTTKEIIAEIINQAEALGIDPAKLLGQAGVVIDAEFTEVTPRGSAAGLEDLLA